jgi:hypothetical protein
MKRRHELVLAVHPNVRGLAYVLCEGPLAPVDWGMRRALGPQKNTFVLDHVRRLVDHWQPDLLIIEDCLGAGSRKRDRIRRLHRLIRNYAEGQALETSAFSRQDVRKCFDVVGAQTRYEIATAIAARVPAFSTRLPRQRTKPWENEDQRLMLFDAAALALTYFCLAKPLNEIPVDLGP